MISVCLLCPTARDSKGTSGRPSCACENELPCPNPRSCRSGKSRRVPGLSRLTSRGSRHMWVSVASSSPAYMSFGLSRHGQWQSPRRTQLFSSTWPSTACFTKQRRKAGSSTKLCLPTEVNSDGFWKFLPFWKRLALNLSRRNLTLWYTEVEKHKAASFKTSASRVRSSVHGSRATPGRDCTEGCCCVAVARLC